MVNEVGTPSIYDLALVAKLPLADLDSLDLLSNPEFINTGSSSLYYLLDLLVDNQYADGSWGSKYYSYSDRLINTLAAVSSLAFNRGRWREITDISFPVVCQNSLDKAISWLNDKLQHYSAEMKNDLADLAGFELLFLALLAEIDHYNLSLPDLSHDLKSAITYKTKVKLNKVDRKFIYQAGSSLSHALEFTGELLSPKPEQLVKAISSNGSVGNSPAATAFTLNQIDCKGLSGKQRQQLLTYLNQAAIRKDGRVVGWPETYPVTQFISIWYEYYYQLLYPNQKPELAFTKSLAAKVAVLSNKGMGADENFAVDCDTTTTYIVLRAENLAEQGDFEQLRNLLDTMVSFFDSEKGYFITYPAEMTVSVTTNAHAWQALNLILKLVENKPENREWLTVSETTLRFMQKQAGNFIYNKVINECYWNDKWHISPTYATLQVVASGLLDNKRNWLTKILKDLLRKQAPDGGWSFISTKSNFDETFHCLLLIKLLTRKLKISTSSPLLNKVMSQASAFLTINEEEIESMWCGKVLYTPVGLFTDLMTLITEDIKTGAQVA